MKFRIVAGHPCPAPLGVKREIVLAQKMRELGHDAVVYRACAPGQAAQSQDYGGTFRAFDTDGPIDQAKKAASAQLANRLREDRPDVVMVKGFDYDVVKSAVHALSDDVPVIAIIGGTAFLPNDPVIQRINFILEEWHGQMARFHSEYTRSVGCLFLPEYLDWDIIEGLDRPADQFDIINVGNFAGRGKRQELLLPMTDCYRLCFVGEGDRRPHFEALAKGSRFPATFTGQIDKPGVFAHLARSRMMVHTSMWEGFPRAIIEALGMGLPVLAHEHAFPHMPAPAWGRLCSDATIYGEIGRVLSDEPLRLEMSANARDFARSYYSHDLVFSVFREAIKAVTGADIPLGTPSPARIAQAVGPA